MSNNREGFWYSEYEKHLPMPVHNNNPWPNQEKFLLKLKSKQLVSHQVRYRGMSLCRICNCINGYADCNLDGWTWPSGYAHYIEKHNVKPSEKFYHFIMNT
jgi:hypothetical protein